MGIFSVLLVTIGIRVASAAPKLWEQCRLQNGTEIACDKGLVCIPDVEHYGLCYTKVVEESGQCGGLNWNVSCVNGTTCERQNEGWASCESIVDTPNPAAEWQQCDLEDSGNACSDDLICVDDSDYHGLCVQEVAELWGQCGGSGWTTDCESGSWCEIKSATYSQCVPDDSQAEDLYTGDSETRPAASPQTQETTTFFDMSSLTKPLAQLQEIAAAMKRFPCSIQMMVFPETTCEDSTQASNSTWVL